MESSRLGSSSPHQDSSDGEAHDHPSPAELESPIPPYWLHRRDESYSSVGIVRPPPITLEDHTEEPSEQSKSLWAKGVTIDDYVTVSGNVPRVGDYVVWNCKVETLDGGPMVIRKRYSEFDDLRNKLLITFPHSEAAMPPLPPKSVVFKFRPKFLEKRRIGLAYFLNCVLLNPEFSGSPVLKEFIFN